MHAVNPKNFYCFFLPVGIPVYFAYGLRHSVEENTPSHTRDGVSNLGFGANGLNSMLIIPTIQIQPATPTNSEPGTMRAKPKEKSPLPPSPLVRVKVESETSSEITYEMELKSALASLDKVVNDPSVERVRLESKTTDSYLEDNKSSEETKIISNGDINTGKLPLLIGISSMDSRETKMIENVSSSNKKKQSPVEPDDLEYKTESVELEKLAKDVTENETNIRRGDKDKSASSIIIKGVALEVLLKAREPEPPYEFTKQDGEVSANIEKQTKKRPGPLIITREGDNLQSANDSDGEDDTELRISHSAPVLPSSPPPPPPLPTSTPLHSKPVPAYSSVPSTPVTKRHPFKVLKRMSSFDDIPPSSPDSPFARRLGNKFIIIPVQEPGRDSDYNSSSQVSPMKTPFAFKKLPDTENPSSQDVLMNELLAKLGKHSKSADSADQEEESKSQKPLFTVGSNDSLEGMTKGTDSNIFRYEMASLTVTGQSRDFKKTFSRDSMLEVLDPIRERGESKILPYEDEKREIQTSVTEKQLTDSRVETTPVTSISKDKHRNLGQGDAAVLIAQDLSKQASAKEENTELLATEQKATTKETNLQKLGEPEDAKPGTEKRQDKVDSSTQEDKELVGAQRESFNKLKLMFEK